MKRTVQETAVIARCHDETVRRGIRDYQDGKPGLRATRRAGSGPRGPYLIDDIDIDAWMNHD